MKRWIPVLTDDAFTSADTNADARHYCWACEHSIAAFEFYGQPPRAGRCPRCGAKPRHRAMLWYLRHTLAPRLGAGTRVLEIGAAKFAVRHFLAAHYLGLATYSALDLRCLTHHRSLPAPHGFVQGSATCLPFASASFDVILCNNTLTYIPQDSDALVEMRRCLQPDGLLMIQTHRHVEPTCSAPAYAARHPELPPSWFAENGDAWVYGPDFFERVHGAGLITRIDVPLAGRDDGFYARYGIKPCMELIVAFRDVAGEARFGLS